MSKAAKRTTKKDQLVRMLKAKAGADVATIGRKLSWQNHTVRAALTGLRKAGYEIVAETPEGGGARRYRIAAEPVSAKGPEATEADSAG